MLSDDGSVVVPGDYDRDGDLDLFVGSRVIPREYGVSPTSRLLENDGSGRFRDVTADKAPELSRVGMVTGAVWRRAGSGTMELVVVGEWMPIRVFSSRDGRLVSRDAPGLARTEGWWSSVVATDLTGDGLDELVLGNLGLNSYIKATAEEPARLYVHDFGQNGVLKQILTTFKNGVSYPIAGRDEIVRPMPSLRSRFPSYAAYGASRIEDIFPSADLAKARVLEARMLGSAVAIARADGGFDVRPLPVEAQLAPVFAALPGDFDSDGKRDLLLGGNFFGVTPMRGRYDAGYGLLLRGDGQGGLRAVDMQDSGVMIPGQVRALLPVRTARGLAIAVARNDDTFLMLRVAGPPSTNRGPQ